MDFSNKLAEQSVKVGFLQKSQINNEIKLTGSHRSPYKLVYYDFEQFEIEIFIYFHIYVMS